MRYGIKSLLLMKKRCLIERESTASAVHFSRIILPIILSSAGGKRDEQQGRDCHFDGRGRCAGVESGYSRGDDPCFARGISGDRSATRLGRVGGHPPREGRG